MLTLNQIISRIKKLSEDHYQLNDFRDSDVWEFDVNGDLKYPALLLEQISGGIDRDNRLHSYVFRFYFVDLVGVSEDTKGNEREVISDMSQVARDFVSMLNHYNYEFDWIIGSSASEIPIKEKFGDLVAGVMIEVIISTDFIVDTCLIPTSSTFTDG